MIADRYFKPSYIITAILALTLLFYERGNYWAAHWYQKWALIQMAIAFWISWVMAKKVTWALFPFLISALCGSVYLVAWESGFYESIVRFQEDFNSLMFVILLASWVLIVGCVVYITLPRKFAPHIKYAMFLFWIVDLIWTICFPDPGVVAGSKHVGFCGNSSANGILLACLLPQAWYVFWRQRLLRVIAFILTAWAIHLTDTSVPIGTLIVVTIAYLWRRDFRLKSIVIGGAILGAAALITKDLWNPADRIQILKTAFGFWEKHSMYSFGTGWGSTVTLFKMIKGSDLPPGVSFSTYYFLHNDWAQILFEAGIVGLFGAVATFLVLVKKSWKIPVLRSQVLGFGAAMIFSYPSHLPIHAVCMWSIMWLTLPPKP